MTYGYTSNTFKYPILSSLGKVATQKCDYLGQCTFASSPTRQGESEDTNSTGDKGSVHKTSLAKDLSVEGVEKEEMESNSSIQVHRRQIMSHS